MTTDSFIGEKSKKIPQFLNKSQIGQPKVINNLLFTSSNIASRIDKSKSITKSGIRERNSNLTPNRSQVNLYTPSKSPLKTPFNTFKKEKSTARLDYSF